MGQNIPKYTTNSLVIRTNYYVVERDGGYHYFPIKADATTLDSPVMRLTKRPPVLLEGVAILGRSVYEVTVGDIMRGIVRKSSLVSGRVNASRRASSTVGNSTPGSLSTPELGGSTNAAASINESGAELDAGLEIRQAADLAWQEQALSLLEALHQKEGGEWEIASSVQPGRADASSAVSDSHADSGNGTGT